jgi:hypothetical protein
MDDQEREQEQRVLRQRLAEQPDELAEEDEGGSAGTSTTASPQQTPGTRVCTSHTKGPGGVTRSRRKPHVDVRAVSERLAARVIKHAPIASWTSDC